MKTLVEKTTIVVTPRTGEASHAASREKTTLRANPATGASSLVVLVTAVLAPVSWEDKEREEENGEKRGRGREKRNGKIRQG